MTNRETLERAVRITTQAGWKPENFEWIPENQEALIEYWLTADNYKSVIFNHGFIKYLFGVEKWEPIGKCHLANMVLSDDPLGYLGAHI